MVAQPKALALAPPLALEPQPPARMNFGLTDRATQRLFTLISEQCWLDYGLVCNGYRLEHRAPEDMGRNFYALTYKGWLVGVEHYQDRPYSLKRVQWLLALLLRARGWIPETVTQVYCDDHWPYAAHRMPRLFGEVEMLSTRELYKLAGMHQRARRHEQLKPMTFERWAWIGGQRGVTAWKAALNTHHAPGEMSGWVNRERYLQWQVLMRPYQQKGE